MTGLTFQTLHYAEMCCWAPIEPHFTLNCLYFPGTQNLNSTLTLIKFIYYGAKLQRGYPSAQ